MVGALADHLNLEPNRPRRAGTWTQVSTVAEGLNSMCEPLTGGGTGFALAVCQAACAARKICNTINHKDDQCYFKQCTTCVAGDCSLGSGKGGGHDVYTLLTSEVYRDVETDATDALPTDAPVAPATDAPATDALVTDAPATNAPATAAAPADAADRAAAVTTTTDAPVDATAATNAPTEAAPPPDAKTEAPTAARDSESYKDSITMVYPGLALPAHQLTDRQKAEIFDQVTRAILSTTVSSESVSKFYSEEDLTVFWDAETGTVTVLFTTPDAVANFAPAAAVEAGFVEKVFPSLGDINLDLSLTGLESAGALNTVGHGSGDAGDKVLPFCEPTAQAANRNPDDAAEEETENRAGSDHDHGHGKHGPQEETEDRAGSDHDHGHGKHGPHGKHGTGGESNKQENKEAEVEADASADRNADMRGSGSGADNREANVEADAAPTKKPKKTKAPKPTPTVAAQVDAAAKEPDTTPQKTTKKATEKTTKKAKTTKASTAARATDAATEASQAKETGSDSDLIFTLDSSSSEQKADASNDDVHDHGHDHGTPPSVSAVCTCRRLRCACGVHAIYYM